jgi:hypothetical protein
VFGFECVSNQSAQIYNICPIVLSNVHAPLRPRALLSFPSDRSTFPQVRPRMDLAEWVATTSQSLPPPSTITVALSNEEKREALKCIHAASKRFYIGVSFGLSAGSTTSGPPFAEAHSPGSAKATSRSPDETERGLYTTVCGHNVPFEVDQQQNPDEQKSAVMESFGQNSYPVDSDSPHGGEYLRYSSGHICPNGVLEPGDWTQLSTRSPSPGGQLTGKDLREQQAAEIKWIRYLELRGRCCRQAQRVPRVCAEESAEDEILDALNPNLRNRVIDWISATYLTHECVDFSRPIQACDYCTQRMSKMLTKNHKIIQLVKQGCVIRIWDGVCTPPKS